MDDNLTYRHNAAKIGHILGLNDSEKHVKLYFDAKQQCAGGGRIE